MGFFGRRRANTTTEISQPTLTFTDAQPRDDLHQLGQLKSPNPRKTDSKSPATVKRTKEFQDAIKAFDFTVTEPPERLDAGDTVEDTKGGYMIGIALGSPSMLPPQSPPRFKPVEWSTITSNVPTEQPELLGTLRRKPSKWKKFGGLFKGKQEEKKEANEPFYKLDMNAHAPSRQESAPRSRDIARPTPFPKFVNDAHHIEPKPPFMENQPKGGNISLLEVDIPAIQMERYSVMFRGVLDKKPDTSLLARRNKTLDKIIVKKPENQHLKPYRPRRATSPAVSSPPSFSLFPDDAKNPSAMGPHASNQPGLKSPRRSNTFPLAAPATSKSDTLAVPDLTPALSTSNSADLSPEDLSPTATETPLVSHVVTKPPKSYTQEPSWDMIKKNPESRKSDAVPVPAPLSTQPKRTESKTSTTSNTTTKPNPAYPVHAVPMFPPRSSSHANNIQTQPKQHPRPHRSRPRSQTMPTNSKQHSQTAEGAVATKQKVVVSTARSVSVSRRGNRAPSRSNGDRRDASSSTTSSSSSPSSSGPAGAGERFGEHQKLIPTVVDIRRGSNHQHKKSEKVAIESL